MILRFLLLSSLVAASSSLAEPAKVQFNRDIRPIFSDTCFHCHGFDAKAREAGMRLDIRAEALKKTDNGVLPIVPGKPEESAIIEHIFSKDKDEVMPPPKAHKELTQAQKETIKRWVAEGAEYEAHWAYAPLVRPAVPGRDMNPVDAFIREKLAARQIAPSPEATKAKLLRRLSLDLTGLPPTPEEVSAFTADAAPDAYEKQVDRLLASPRFGERMAVWWLDVARFTDTVGFHGDQNQRIFPYRDYVINSFNANKRFDRFTIEQLAGDLLPNPTTEQLVATGYNRLNMMTREGGAQPKEYLAKYGAERVRAVAAAWFGSTFGCAECHDHKFDPIKARDFYELQSFFADMKQWGVYSDYGYTKNPELIGYSNEHPFPPEIEVESPYLRVRKERAQTQLDAHLAAARARLCAAPAAESFEKWVGEMRAFLAGEPEGWSVPPVSAVLMKDGKPEPDGDVAIGKDLAVQFEKPLASKQSLRVSVRPGTGWVAAVRVELGPVPRVERKSTGGGQEDGLQLSALVKAADGKERKLGIYFADANAKGPRYDNGAELIGIADGWLRALEPEEAQARPKPVGVWLLDPPVQLAKDDRLVLTVGGDLVAPLRISTSPLSAGDPLRVAEKAVREVIAAPVEQRTPPQRELLADTWLLSTAADPAAFDQYKQLAANVREARNGRAWTLVTQAAEPLTIRVLARGNWQDESGAVVLPSTPSFLPGRIESTADRRLTRLDLAKWIVSKENPITARAVMNRLWAQFFGVGLSAAVDDLGSQGELPSHPELLEWLASEFRDSGWDMKHMIRLFVTSATYRQSSSLRPELRDTDPANRLLASQNPRRLEAEFVRDNALAIAGVLNLRDIGGPSVMPYQPKGYYAALQFPDRDYVASKDDEQWRRGVYMHWQRTFLHPMLANFDAPARDECAAQRTLSNTPQQALTLLNDPTFVEAARLFASRVLAGKDASDEQRIDRAMLDAVARPAKENERASLMKFLAEQRDYFRVNGADAEKFLKVGLAPEPTGDRAELAAWTSLCRVLLNAQETITRY
ncbi:MAG: PSD1 and planctomycete cytochrome C domain-containing protein [Chthoniobacter sp.]|nr:PSD1 and planctomycete cytochrome C domain-containing protein [Chthoniobacter sp.]